jgi:hypothetical protein
MQTEISRISVRGVRRDGTIGVEPTRGGVVELSS